MDTLSPPLIQAVVDETARRCLEIAEEVAREYPFNTQSARTGDWKKGAGAAHIAHRIRAEFNLGE